MAEIEYFYSAHSFFAYVGSARFMGIARAAGRRIVHKPFFLSAAVEAAGSIPFPARDKRQIDYYFRREVERWAEQRGVPVIGRRPTYHDNDMTPASCLVIAAAEQGRDADRLAHAILAAHWTEDADIADPATLSAILSELEFDSDPLLADAANPEIRARYEANTEEAIARSVLGSPTYFVDGDMFYGQDRLEMVERALAKPYRAVTFRQEA